MATEEQTTKEKTELWSAWQNVEGIYLPKLLWPGRQPWEELIPNIRHMKLRDDDVFICAYPKAGTHWLWEVVSMLRLGKAEYEKRPKEQLMMEFVDVKLLEEMPSPRILNTHLPFSMLPVSELKARQIKVVHVYRNPKDSVVSHYHHAKQSPTSGVMGRNFEDVFEVFFSEKAVFGCYFDYLSQMHQFTQANPDVPIMHLSYEDMKKSPLDKVKQLARFLNLDVPDSVCEDVERACRFDNMKQQDSSKQDPVFTRNATENASSSTSKNNPGVPINIDFYRKGQVGDWKNHLTVAMSERVDSMVTHRMKGLPFTLQFEQS